MFHHGIDLRQHTNPLPSFWRKLMRGVSGGTTISRVTLPVVQRDANLMYRSRTCGSRQRMYALFVCSSFSDPVRSLGVRMPHNETRDMLISEHVAVRPVYFPDTIAHNRRSCKLESTMGIEMQSDKNFEQLLNRNFNDLTSSWFHIFIEPKYVVLWAICYSTWSQFLNNWWAFSPLIFYFKLEYIHVHLTFLYLVFSNIHYL